MKKLEINSLCLEEIVVERVHVNVNGDGGARGEASPLPSVVLGVQQEIGGHNGDADGHHDQNREHEQHETVHVVDLVGPERSKHKVSKKIKV